MNNKVFFVDDEKNVLNSILRLFRKTDLKIYTFEDPLEALKLLPEVEPAVIVSDYRMPDMNGIAFFEKVKNIYPLTIKIILSAFTDIATTEAAINKSNVDIFIEKPWDEKELISEVENAVKLYHLGSLNNSGYGIF